MKTILIATDYSAAADNAMRYAAELAKFENAKLILFHAYVPRVLLSSLTLMDGGFEEENLNKLKRYKRELEQKYGSGLEIETRVRNGFTVNGILNVIKEEKADLLVMGSVGASKLKDALFGNTTATIIQSTNTPVLVIPPNVQFKVPKKIAVALNQVESVPKVLKKQILDYVNEFDGKLVIFKMLEKELETMYEKNECKLADEIMDGLRYELCTYSGEDLTEELNRFIDSRKIDWLIMAPQDHPQLSELFHRSNTTKMAFHTHIPLLSVHI